MYNYDNMPTYVNYNGTTTQLVYDGQGNRVKKIAGTTNTVYIGTFYEVVNSGASGYKYIFAGGTRIARKNASATHYYHQDHLGSSSVVTDSSGNNVEEVHYLPFGSAWSDTNATLTTHKFTGQELDAETGLYYYGARYYNPQLGRFISADTIVGNPGDPQDLNRYTYAGNNPLLYTDPTGHFKLSSFFKAVAIGVAGGAAFVLSGGNPVVAGMVAGVVSGAMTGKAKNAFIGGVTGGLLGGFGGVVSGVFGAAGAYGMLAAGGGVAYYQGGLDGVAYFAGGIAGGIGGAVMVSNLTSPTMASGQPIDDDPLHYDGNRLTATDANGNQIGSWDATSGRPGTTPAEQYIQNKGPIPSGNYSVNPQQIQRWNDLPFRQKVYAYFGRGEWRGGTTAWGHTRVPIEISPGTYTGPRTGNFFIHGGVFPGSAGCIDVGANEASFFGYLSGQNSSIPLTVQYGR